MYIVEVFPQLFYHYHLRGNLIIGNKLGAKLLTLEDVKLLNLVNFKLVKI